MASIYALTAIALAAVLTFVFVGILKPVSIAALRPPERTPGRGRPRG